MLDTALFCCSKLSSDMIITIPESKVFVYFALFFCISAITPIHCSSTLLIIICTLMIGSGGQGGKMPCLLGVFLPCAEWSWKFGVACSIQEGKWDNWEEYWYMVSFLWLQVPLCIRVTTTWIGWYLPKWDVPCWYTLPILEISKSPDKIYKYGLRSAANPDKNRDFVNTSGYNPDISRQPDMVVPTIRIRSSME